MMNKIINDYISYLNNIKHLSPLSIKVYVPHIRNMIEYCKFKTIEDIQNSNIIQLQYWIDSKNEMSNQYQNQCIASCKSFFGYLVAYRFITFNPARELKALSVESKGHAGNVEQINKIREYVKNEYDKKPNFNNLRNILIVEVLLQSAVRNMELRQLNIDSIKEDGSFTVIQKGGNQKQCCINSKAMEVYNKYIDERLKIDSKDNALFISSYKSRLTSKGLEKIIDKITRATGQRLRVHDIRHTSLTAYIKAGYSIENVAKLAGHSNSTTTYKFYYHQDKNDKKSMAESVF